MSHNNSLRSNHESLPDALTYSLPQPMHPISLINSPLQSPGDSENDADSTRVPDYAGSHLFNGSMHSKSGSLRDDRDDAEHRDEPPCEDDQKLAPKPRTVAAVVGYFGFTFGNAAIGAFMGVIFKEKGFSAIAIGNLVAIIPFFSVVLLPVSTFIVDKFHCVKLMMTVCVVGSTVMLWVYTTFSVKWLVVVTFIFMVAFQTPMAPLLDHFTLSLFPSGSRMNSWSYVRAWGSYGWGLGNPIATVIVTWAGTWSVTIIQYAIGMAGLLYCFFAAKPYEEIERVPVRVRDILGLLAHNKRLTLFLLAACLMGMGYSFINNFLFIFLDEIGGTKILFGLTLLLTVSTEVPIFRFYGHLSRWLSDRMMLSIAMGLWVLRVLGYSFLTNPWVVLFLEPLHGITFCLMWLPGVHIVNTVFPPQLASSAMGVLFTFEGGIGPVIGNIIAGVLYEKIGPRWMFRTAAITMATGLITYLALDHLMERMGLQLMPKESEGHGNEEAERVESSSPAASPAQDRTAGNSPYNSKTRRTLTSLRLAKTKDITIVAESDSPGASIAPQQPMMSESYRTQAKTEESELPL